MEWSLMDGKKDSYQYIFCDNIIPAWPLCKVERNVICLFVCLFCLIWGWGTLSSCMSIWLLIITVRKWCYFFRVLDTFSDPVPRSRADFARSGPEAFRLFLLFFPFFVAVSSLSEAALPSPSPAPPSNAAALICAVKKAVFLISGQNWA